MTDTSQTPVVEVSQTWKTIITICTLICSGLTILYLIVWGNPANSLHTSALAWSFATVLGVLAGLGFGALAPLVVNVKK